MNMQFNISLIQQVSDILIEMLGDDFDEKTFWDSLDGEADAMDIIGQLIKQRTEAKAFSIASKDLASEYTARSKRLDAKVDAIQASLGAILDATKQKKVTHPLVTVSRTKPRISMKIYDETKIPTQLTNTIIKPDTAAIKAQLEAGEVVDGAELVAGEFGVMVRVK